MKIPKRIVPLLIILGLAGIAVRARAQNAPPDFTGTWTLDLAKSKPDKRFPVKEQTIVITYANQTIQFAYTTDGKPLPLSYVVDGKERAMPNPMFPKSDNFIKAEWKKSALDIVTISRMGPLGYNVDNVFLSQHWMLSSDGKTLTEKTGSDFDSGHLYVYEKQ